MADWDDEDADWDADAPKSDNEAKPSEDLWADEDAESGDDAAGGDWDAPEEKKAEPVAPKAPAVKKKKTAKQIAKEKEEAEAKARAAQKVTGQFKEMTLEERRRAEEQADLALSADLFGEAPPMKKDEGPANADNDDMAASGIPLPVLDQKAGIEDFKLEKKIDYENFAKEVAKHVCKTTQQKNVLAFLKVLLTESTKKMNAPDFAEFTKHSNVISNAKAKQISNKKAPKNTKKAQLKMGSSKGGDYDDWGGNSGGRGYDTNDYDFI
jgi:hypothetical protein